jgi:transposase
MVKMSGKATFKLREHRYFSETFKKSKVDEILYKKVTVKELSVLYEIAEPVIYRWIRKYSKTKEAGVKIHFEMESEAQKTLFYKEKVAELERLVGIKQIEIEFLNKIMELASNELKIDIKKNFTTSPLSGLGKTHLKSDSK